MSLVFKSFVATVILSLCTLSAASTPPLRVCTDSNNLPFSNVRGEGFENAIARIVAHDLQREIQFVWLPQQAPAAKRALKTQNCDLIMGLASPSDVMVPSIPYYRSIYVFVSRQDRHLQISSLDDRRLSGYRIGAHIIGFADAAVPPAEELVRRGLVRNIVGYSLYGDPLADNPPSELITAVERDDIDIAVAWGPMAGYFAKQSKIPLDVTPICQVTGDSGFRMDFDISMGVRRGDDLLLKEVNQIIVRRREPIQYILRSYGVPVLQAGCR